MHRLHVNIKGIVQGVGFRPFVHALASRFKLTGWVKNDSRGVEIEVDGPSRTSLDRFLSAISAEAPPLSDIFEIKSEFTKIETSEKHADFRILKSAPVTGERVLISPDVMVCPDCLREMYDPRDRRWRYPFLNCTNCGPRFTIIRELPYDRPLTTMASFPMCDACGAEYVNPSDRRFHAQPTCCPDCGPELAFLNAEGNPVDGDPIDLAIRALREGKTLAIKGIGGFHLACDAINDDAVRRLRRNKHREAKPLAVMVGGISAAKRLAEVSIHHEKLLLSPARPIIIVPERSDSPLPGGCVDGIWGVNGGMRTVGLMLPYAPLHHLLFRPLPVRRPDDPSAIIPPEEIGGPSDASFDAFAALVMTSGNLTDEPIAVDNADALKRLKGIADGFLLHNRDIYRRCDDSVVAVGLNGRQVWRLARGYSPRPILLPEPLPRVLGVGPEMKNSICHIRDDKAFISPHIGDLKTFEAYEYFLETIAHQERILDVRPEYVACDLHPDYHSTRWAEESGLPLTRVQHHHAHIVALMAEHGVLDRKIIGVAMDGTGLGDDGAIWGGEILVCDPVGYERAGHFSYAPLPGGDAAVKEVWRSALGRLANRDGELPAEFLALFGDVPTDRLLVVQKMIRAGVNCPPVGSLGRLFDAAAFIAGLGSVAQYDGQLPMLLEAACEGILEMEGVKFDFDAGQLIFDQGGAILLDGSTILEAMARRRIAGQGTVELARWFHKVVIDLLYRVALITLERTGIDTIGLSGGCFMNRLLENSLVYRLTETGGCRVLTHSFSPPNDGCVSLGQAISAGYRLVGVSH